MTQTELEALREEYEEYVENSRELEAALEEEIDKLRKLLFFEKERGFMF